MIPPSRTDFSAASMPRVVSRRRTTTRIGYIGLVDAAPILVAEAYGIFEKYGLSVALSREVGWATIREKIMFGELEAAHALSTLPFVSTLGLGAPAVNCVSAVVLSRGGNSIILSEEIRRRGVKNKETLKLDVDNRKAFRSYKLATVYGCSPHHFHLREWLESADIDPEKDVELVTLPPAQMCRNLAAGTIDGFCAGEPWGSRAISEKIGWSVINSDDLYPRHPEKVLMVKQTFTEQYPEEHSALVAALVDACAICEDPSQRLRVTDLLSDRKRVNCPAHLIEQCLSPTYNYGLGRVENRPNFLTFYSDDSNRPDVSDTEWVLKRMQKYGKTPISGESLQRMSHVFRPDLFDVAMNKAPAV